MVNRVNSCYRFANVRERFSAIVERFEVSSHELREAFVTRNLPPILQIRPQKRAQNTGQAFSSHESRKAFVQFVTPFHGALLGGSWGGGRVSCGLARCFRGVPNCPRDTVGQVSGTGVRPKNRLWRGEYRGQSGTWCHIGGG